MKIYTNNYFILGKYYKIILILIFLKIPIFKWIEEILIIRNIILSITINKYLTNIIIKKRIPKLFFNFVLVFIIILILVLIIGILLFEQRNLIRKFDNIKYKEETGHLDIIIRLKLDK